MKKILFLSAILLGAVSVSQAGVRFGFGIGLPLPGVVISQPAPVYTAPPAYCPPPVYYSPPPVCYSPPAVVVEPPSFYFGFGGPYYHHHGYWGHGYRGGWGHHHGWRR